MGHLREEVANAVGGPLSGCSVHGACLAWQREALGEEEDVVLLRVAIASPFLRVCIFSKDSVFGEAMSPASSMSKKDNGRRDKGLYRPLCHRSTWLNGRKGTTRIY